MKEEDQVETNEATQALVDSLAAPIIKQHNRSKKFVARNRNATKRMNRPEKLAKLEKGAGIIMNFLDRNIHGTGSGISESTEEI